MESNIDNDAIDVGVLAPNDQENEDANRNAQFSVAAGTPVARKTRRAVLRRMNATSEKDSPTQPDPPKTPGTPGNLRPATETPRRSCRKSVRPAIDYDDIIVRSAKKVIAEAIEGNPENGETSTQKWSSAEVGRNSRKRTRKSKCVTTKKQKKEKEMPEDKIEEKQETKFEVPEEKPQDQEETAEVPTDLVEEVEQQGKPQAAESEKENPSKYNKVAEAYELGLSPLEMDSQEDEPEIQAGDTTLTAPQDKNKEEAVEEEDKLSPVEDNDDQKHDEKDEQASETTRPAKLNEDKLVANVPVVPEEEMPSLLVENEDLDEPEKSPLNTTYDAEEKKDSDESVILISTSNLDASAILVVSPDKQPEACIPKPKIAEEKAAIKVVLTTADDQNQTILNLADVASPKASKPTKSKGFRFPTPYKARPVFNFTETVEAFDNKHMNKDSMKAEEPKYERKRSKSASDWNNTVSRTVSFQSPIEIANVEDIDERWKGLQISNVNNRRRRSKSLDENRCKVSKIPKPSRGVIPLNRTITPSKVNKRTKMPNFAAMHEKQFAKMESLLDHVERKAERAKVLTNSVQKQLPGSTAKKPQSSTSVEERPRPKALKKIDMPADRSMVIERPSNKLNSSRLPLKTTAPALNVAPKPAFNLSTSMVKTFNATFSSKPADSQDNKLAERRQRRIEMFKGRTTKDQKEKGQFIRGVRLNRRFELQMQHRRHLEED
ncbi:proteoglycan 4 [Drosophila subpulchrella]|uniref:proteoglycan 4 n=1 Tax=Drosophila subpulchrella TaxID=1486046 RepID=UPI0018A1AD41|nr:proteoglycan 4 [Drosophila subpulchrella]